MLKKIILLTMVAFVLTSCIHRFMYTAPELNYEDYVKTQPEDLGLSLEYVGGVGEGSSGKIVEYVDPFIGTAGHGHTFPGATRPFGMVQISPDNGVDGWDWCSGYHRFSNYIVYFSHKHLSGTGGTDLGDIGFMPSFTGKIGEYKFSHDDEFAYPGYYAVKLNNGILAEFTATDRAAYHRYTYTHSVSKRSVAVDLHHYVGTILSFRKNSYFKKIDDKTWGGLRYSGGWAPQQRAYFVARFSEPVQSSKGNNIRRVFAFKPSDQPLEVKVALSTVSIDNALANLDTDIGDKSFESIRTEAVEAWENELSKITVSGEDVVLKRIFYTAQYHAYIAPNLLSDTDGKYSEPSGKVTQCNDFQRYSTFSLWDTYRASHPLFVFTQPQLVDDFINSMLAHYDERGFLPIWELEANETFTMIGNHAIPVIVEAFVKGLQNFDVEKAYQACIDTVNQEHRSLPDYGRLGYVPYDKERESVSKTLEYAYNDWCVAVFAEALGKPDDAIKYYNRAQNYNNLFDEETGLMRPKHSNGQWLDNFDPYTHAAFGYRHYTEGNAWQYTWSVQHDPMGLIGLYGSNETFLNQFDQLFQNQDGAGSSDDLVDVTGLIGQYAHGNEPSHHTIFFYNYTSKPYRTQELTKEIISSFYTDKPDGIIGNDDCGQMSAWYIFTAMGLYPMDPVSGKYELTTPTFSEIQMKLENGNIFRVKTDSDPNENIYIDKIEFNGIPIVDPYITYDMILNGGELKYFLSTNG